MSWLAAAVAPQPLVSVWNLGEYLQRLFQLTIFSELDAVRRGDKDLLDAFALPTLVHWYNDCMDVVADHILRMHALPLSWPAHEFRSCMFLVYPLYRAHSVLAELPPSSWNAQNHVALLRKLLSEARLPEVPRAVLAALHVSESEEDVQSALSTYVGMLRPASPAPLVLMSDLRSVLRSVSRATGVCSCCLRPVCSPVCSVLVRTARDTGVRSHECCGRFERSSVPLAAARRCHSPISAVLTHPERRCAYCRLKFCFGGRACRRVSTANTIADCGCCTCFVRAQASGGVSGTSGV